MVFITIFVIHLVSTVLCQQIPCDDIVQCPEGSSCHPGQGLCYEDPTPTDKLHVWLGNTLTGCDRKPTDCDYFDMEFDILNIRGDGDWCDTGLKVRCLVKDPPQPTIPGPANILKVVSWNVFERIWFASLDGQRERTCRIAQFLNSHPVFSTADVVTFQEVFMGGCWPQDVSLKDLLRIYGYLHITKTVNSNLRPENGGIFIASRHPILEEDQIVFKNFDPNSWDRLSSKGVSYAKIQKTSIEGTRTYHIGATHFQAGGPAESKLAQAQEWADFLKMKNIPQDEAVIFTGDLNTNFWDTTGNWNKTLEILGVAQPILAGALNASDNPLFNDLLQLKGNTGWGSWIDHVLYSVDHIQPTHYTTEIFLGKFQTPMPVCWCEECIDPLRFTYVYPEEEDGCDRIEYVRDLGDHQPVYGYFEFP